MDFSIKIFTLFFVIWMTLTLSNANEPDPVLGRKITLVSKTNDTFEMYEKGLSGSPWFESFLKEDEFSTQDTMTIPLPNVESETLRLIVKWAQHHYEQMHSEQELDEFDEVYTKQDQAILIDVLASANYMHLIELKELMCKAIASLIHGKTPEQIREIFGIRNDFLDAEPEEEPVDVENQPSSSSSRKLDKGKASTSSRNLDEPSSSKRHDTGASSSSSSKDISKGDLASTSTRKKEGSVSKRRDEGSSSKASKRDKGSTSSRRDDKAAKGSDSGSKSSRRVDKASKIVETGSTSGRHESSSKTSKGTKGDKSSKGDGSSSSRTKEKSSRHK